MVGYGGKEINTYIHINQNQMNLLFWKHKKEKHVIKQECFNKLPRTAHSYYEETNDLPTHHYDDNSGLLTGILVGEMLADNNRDSSVSPAPDTAPAFEG